MVELLIDPQSWIAVATLALLEIVLGIDNIVFIAIVSSRLPVHRQSLARKVGLLLALGIRIVLLFALSWIIGLSKPWLTLPFGIVITGRTLLLLLGGLFLIYKATQEIYHKTECLEEEQEVPSKAALGVVLVQIAVMDGIFSLDSIITAVGMVNQVPLMVVAVCIAVGVMILFADPVAKFVDANPSVKILALAFLLLIGVMLTAEGTGRHIEKGYIYFAMGFSLVVELLNLRYRHNRKCNRPLIRERLAGIVTKKPKARTVLEVDG